MTEQRAGSWPGRIIATLVALTCLAPAAAAQPGDPIADRMVQVFQAWAREFRIERATLAVIRNGEVARTAVAGNAVAGAPYPIASLSKAVSGVCITRLVELGRLRYDSPLGEVLGRFMARTRQPADPRFRSVTVAQLLTHTSGFTDEMTRGVWSHHSVDAMARTALGRPIPNPPGSQHRYANVNFALIDLIIQELTGERYGTACRKLVLEPVGAGRAGLFHRHRPPPIWVDWQFSAEDFGRFMRYFDSQRSPLRIRPDDWPKHDLGNGAFYGPGVAMRRFGAGRWNMWHNGGYAFSGPNYRVNYATFFAHWASRTGFFVDFSPINDQARDTLDRRMFEASQIQAPAPSRPAPTPERLWSTDLPGNDYHAFPVPNTARGDVCREACVADARCHAYTLVRPPGGGAGDSSCRLKSPAPVRRVQDHCCMSQIVR
ncbi:serine hydrolase [Phreatobacter sp.]|uniref:serine hydrolase n=1 Tax=Phreatobacter sp. TaxID=1966341 RepID=UPI003F71E16E